MKISLILIIITIVFIIIALLSVIYDSANCLGTRIITKILIILTIILFIVTVTVQFAETKNDIEVQLTQAYSEAKELKSKLSGNEVTPDDIIEYSHLLEEISELEDKLDKYEFSKKE